MITSILQRNFLCLSLLLLIMLSLFIVMIDLRVQFNYFSDSSLQRGREIELDGTSSGLFHFIHVSDTHLHEPKNKERTARVRKFLQEDVRIIQPSFIVHSGDVTDGHPSLSESVPVLKDWQKYNDLLLENDMKSPEFFIDMVGNHDKFDLRDWLSEHNFFRTNLSNWGPLYEGAFQSGPGTIAQLDVAVSRFSERANLLNSSPRVIVTPDQLAEVDDQFVPFDSEPRIGLFNVNLTSDMTVSLIMIDSTPQFGQGSIFNFFAQRSSLLRERIQRLTHDLQASARFSQIFLIDHYPNSLLSRSDSDIDGITARLCGHEHVRGLHYNRRSLDLEVADFKDKSVYAVFALDNGLLSFTASSLSSFPLFLATHPKDARYQSTHDPNVVSSTHIRVLIFESDNVTITDDSVNVHIDELVVCTLRRVEASLFACPWNQADYGTGFHDFSLKMDDEVVYSHRFSLEGKKQYLGSSFIRLGNLLQVGQAIQALVVTITLFSLFSFLIVPWLLQEKIGEIHSRRPTFFFCWLQRHVRRFSSFTFKERILLFVIFATPLILPIFMGKINSNSWGFLFIYGKLIGGSGVFLGPHSANEANLFLFVVQILILIPFAISTALYHEIEASLTAPLKIHWPFFTLSIVILCADFAFILATSIAGEFNLIILSPIHWIAFAISGLTIYRDIKIIKGIKRGSKERGVEERKSSRRLSSRRRRSHREESLV